MIGLAVWCAACGGQKAVGAPTPTHAGRCLSIEATTWAFPGARRRSEQVRPYAIRSVLSRSDAGSRSGCEAWRPSDHTVRGTPPKRTSREWRPDISTHRRNAGSRRRTRLGRDRSGNAARRHSTSGRAPSSRLRHARECGRAQSAQRDCGLRHRATQYSALVKGRPDRSAVPTARPPRQP